MKQIITYYDKQIQGQDYKLSTNIDRKQTTDTHFLLFFHSIPQDDI